MLLAGRLSGDTRATHSDCNASDFDRVCRRSAGSRTAPCPDFRDCLGVGPSVRHCPVGAFRHRLRATLWEVRPSWFPVRSQGRVLHLASLPAQASSPYTFTSSFCYENRLPCHRRLGASGAGIGRRVRTSGLDQVLHSFKTDFKFSLQSLLGLTLPQMIIGCIFLGCGRCFYRRACPLP